MTRGRKRKFDASIPKHIDQSKIPNGVYWRPSKTKAGSGTWWLVKDGTRKNIASEAAMLSDLFAITETGNGLQRGTLEYVFEAFHASTEFRELAIGTQKGYLQSAKAISTLPTKLGKPLGELQVDKLNIPIIQRIIESIGKEHPTKANHALRYMRRTFAWAMRHGECKTNPADGVKQLKERKLFKMPDRTTFLTMMQFAKERGARQPHSEGSVAPYLAPIMQLAYSCRLRGIEVCTLTDADYLQEGVQCKRRKGSLNTITLWNDDMRAAWEALTAERKKTIDRTRKPIGFKPEARYLVVSQSGDPLVKSSFDSAWQRMIKIAIKENVITAEQRFSLHGLKHRGVTDTEGTKAQKKDASGHKSDAAFHVYDHEIQTVKPPKSN